MSYVLCRLTDTDRRAAADLYWRGFHGSLGRILAPEPLAVAFLEQAIRPEFGLAVTERGGPILGVAGFKAPEGGFIQAGFPEIRNVYGTMGTLWRGPLLELYDRAPVPDQMLVDGICVAEHARGRGIGTLLTNGILSEARNRHLPKVQLEVARDNLRARALYERLGFVATNCSRGGFLGPLTGFGASISMIRKL